MDVVAVQCLLTSYPDDESDRGERAQHATFMDCSLRVSIAEEPTGHDLKVSRIKKI